MWPVVAVGTLLMLPVAASAACLPDMSAVTLTGTITSSVNSAHQPYYSLAVDKPYCVHDPDTNTNSAATKSLYLGPEQAVAALRGKKVTIAGHLSASGSTVTMLNADKVTPQ